MTDISTYDAIRAIAVRLVRERYPTAVAAIIGGSFATGRQTPTSDIDLLLLFDHVDCAWRDTLVAEGRTVELFAHDMATFTYFCKEIDAPGGKVPLVMMVVEGENILAPGAQHAQLLALAQAIVAAGPPLLDVENLQRRRYAITTALEDLVDSAHPGEALAVACQLYEALADLHLRAAGVWSGGGKHLFRRLQAFDAAVAGQLDGALRLVASDLPAGQHAFGQVAAAVLAPVGGPLLEGFTLPAPAHWRSAPAA
ncbi:nucleotidyltransferase domain-containing protein [Janthinobacterium sp. SUN211]|uniref:nucleotidyltransferase domain-containing protein n=1 Tax=unclassified Janthinobacterium TaxID=2610881 RepID=UPI0025B29CAE|nr:MULTISPECIES: nucleotidyltransferase domain-containing protein [unclassified Janthinobacterium]MDN2672522.1 nucleotidyltransferase domain-containing protein [Janthinobacterium sp. SUN026]MDN2702838.1 nucleotidyltransferase domain-containing protein [Janthinobacterium sp. SUN100]MDO8050634.1 nucleotidyltransferase domain-containing protein [Janthinobacterium sp. SUN211]